MMIEDGVEGLLVAPGDPEAARKDHRAARRRPGPARRARQRRSRAAAARLLARRRRPPDGRALRREPRPPRRRQRSAVGPGFLSPRRSLRFTRARVPGLPSLHVDELALQATRLAAPTGAAVRPLDGPQRAPDAVRIRDGLRRRSPAAARGRGSVRRRLPADRHQVAGGGARHLLRADVPQRPAGADRRRVQRRRSGRQGGGRRPRRRLDLPHARRAGADWRSRSRSACSGSSPPRSWCGRCRPACGPPTRTALCRVQRGSRRGRS